MQLRDAISPFYEGVYDPAAEGDWLEAGDLVLGYVAPSGQAYAYPHKILNFHELVNDEIDGIPVLVSYCPLCGSGVVFDRRLGGRMLRFGNTSALYGSDLVMFDWETNSYWWQVAGEAIVGTLSGETLTVLASTTAQWSTWKSLHPETLVLTRNTGFNRNYSFDPFADYALQLSFGGPPSQSMRPPSTMDASPPRSACSASSSAVRAPRTRPSGWGISHSTMRSEASASLSSREATGPPQRTLRPVTGVR